MALAVPLSRFASRVGGGSAFFVRHIMRRLNLPKYDRPIRYICAKCGGWWEGDANRLIVAGITGHEPDDPDLQQTISARQTEMSPLARHRERCNGNIRIVYQGSPDWDLIDHAKRES